MPFSPNQHCDDLGKVARRYLERCYASGAVALDSSGKYLTLDECWLEWQKPEYADFAIPPTKFTRQAFPEGAEL